MLSAAIESASRNRMLDLVRTTCRRMQPEAPPEHGHSRTHEGSPDGLFVGVWFSLVPDFSGVLVSEAVDDVDQPARRRPHAEGTRRETGHNKFRYVSGSQQRPSSSETPSPEERSDFDCADAAEWKGIVDSGSVGVLDPVAADAVRR